MIPSTRTTRGHSGRSAMAALGSLVFVLASCMPTAQSRGCPASNSGTVGPIAPGQTIAGELGNTGRDDRAGYHTYYVDIPAGTSQMTIAMEASGDLDLAAKHGGQISGYGNFDWDFLNKDFSHGATFVVNNPDPGRWYIDVITFLNGCASHDYTLTVTTDPATGRLASVATDHRAVAVR